MSHIIYTPLGPITIEKQEPARISMYRLSRLYGYHNLSDGHVESIPHELKLIKYVITTIAESNEPVSMIVSRLIKTFNQAELRNRSRKRWIRKTIIGLVRPIYAGLVETPNGDAISFYYKPIVSRELFDRAYSKIGKR
jgi:hypothetical protein